MFVLHIIYQIMVAGTEQKQHYKLNKMVLYMAIGRLEALMNIYIQWVDPV